MFRQYRAWARERGVEGTTAVRAHFDFVRTRILRTILATSPDGYGASDARFLLGLIQWDAGDSASALRLWRDLGPDGRNVYGEASDAITLAIARPGRTNATVSSILGAEYRRWLTFSAARLESFGFGFDTF